MRLKKISYIIKSIFNRWIILRRLRRIYIYPFYSIVKSIIRRYENGPQGGLIFFSLTKE